MPSVWTFCFIVNIIFLAITGTVRYAWVNFIYPTPFWFINAILCFFAVSYILFKLTLSKLPKIQGGGKILLATAAIIAFICNVVWYLMHDITPGKVTFESGGYQVWFFYFIFFLWGYWNKLKGRKASKSSPWSILYVIVSIIAFHGYKLIATKIEILHFFQFLLVPFLLFWVVVSFRSFAEYVIKCKLPETIKNTFIWLSNRTLDIYVVQVLLINILAPYFNFPINILIFILTILFVAYFNNIIAVRLQSYLIHLIGKAVQLYH